MKACVLEGINRLIYQDVATPEPKSGEVLLNVRAAGICGSDIQRVFTKGTYSFPTIPGHEFSGEVVAVGDGVSKDWIGKRACVFPLLPCGHCAACQIGEYAQCSSYNYYGSRCDGGFAEYLAVKEENLVEISGDISFEEAAMCEPCAVAIHALSQAGVMYGDVVGIYGAGTIGLMLAKIARSWGASKVVLIDVDGTKLDFANKLGFSHTINSKTENLTEKVALLTDGKGFDICVEGAGVSVSVENCLITAKTFGKVVLMGNPISDISLSQKAYWEILRKQLTLKGTWNSSYNGACNDWKKAVTAMKGLNLTQLITHRYRFEACNDAFNLLKDRKEFAVKVMFVNEK